MFTGNNSLTLSLWLVFIIMTVVTAKIRNSFVLDQRFVCDIKRSCVECLRLSHCSWCVSENSCFSKELSTYQGFCKNDAIDYKDIGFSLEENAVCSCENSKTESNCYMPDMTKGEVCSGRGNCICGRCICDPNPDPKQPSKQIMGEFCEFDNFSCDGPHCNEGPYLLSQAIINDVDFKGTIDVEKVAEV